MNSIGPGYFNTLGVPLAAGRDFTIKDVEEVQHGRDKDDFSPRVVIINQKFAQKFFGKTNPLGRHVGFGSNPASRRTWKSSAW